MNLSDSLKQLYSMWTAGRSIAADVGRQAIGKGYPIFSWYSIMSGMGLFPSQKDLRPAPRAGPTTGGDRQPPRAQRAQLPRPAGSAGRHPKKAERERDADLLLVDTYRRIVMNTLLGSSR